VTISLHVEPTSRCTLGCPRCARTMMLEKFGKKSLQATDLNIDDFNNFLDIPVELINFCGTFGDPIYHRNFKKLIEVSKKKTNKIKITTNGSHRTKNWWQAILSTLGSNDNIVFSIDGTPENFSKYRINGNWDSILVGINECVKSSVNVTWKYIPFSYNQNDIEYTKNLAIDLGVDEFQVEYSNRWENDDWLKPTDQKLIGQRDSIQYVFKNQNKQNLEIDPLCKNQKEHYISASGYYMPCCYVADFRFYYKSEWWKNKNIHDIKTTKLSDQLEIFKNFYKRISLAKTEYCLFNCGNC